jgi:microcystin-dependent protein
LATGVRYYTPNQFEFDSNGVPLVGGQLFTYITGTSTPLATYSDVNLTVPNSNPIVADGNGRFGSIFLGQTQAYKIQLYTAIPAGASQSDSTPSSPLGTQIWTEDPCGPAAGGVQTVTGIIGEIRQFAGLASAIPSQWYPCYGQAVNRSTYSAAFAVLGTTWGAGDGSTTFNLPDLRGRITIGLDNMGGAPANRITSAVCGLSGVTLGASGGSQNSQADTLTAVTTLTDPGHFHVLNHATGTFGSGGTNAWIGGSAAPSNTNSGTTGITASTSVTSSLTGATQNIQPGAMVNSIIYLAA